MNDMSNKKRPINDADLFQTHRRVFKNFLKNELKVSNSTYVTLIHEYRDRVTRKNIRVLYNLHMVFFLEILLDQMDREIESGDMKRYLKSKQEKQEQL